MINTGKRKVWALQDAKNQFSAMVNLALEDGPQFVSRHGKTMVVIMSVGDYEKGRVNARPLSEFLRTSPLGGMEFPRNREKVRQVQL